MILGCIFKLTASYSIKKQNNSLSMKKKVNTLINLNKVIDR